jgi:hypothetical protein
MRAPRLCRLRERHPVFRRRQIWQVNVDTADPTASGHAIDRSQPLSAAWSAAERGVVSH